MTDDTRPDPLILGERAGLSDDIAMLRPTFPRAGWRGHANFGQLADFWLQIHATLRAEAAEVARIVTAFRDRGGDSQAFGRAFVPALNRFLQHLDQHHNIEDHAYFPKFRALDPRMQAGFDLLDSDHRLIHDQLAATVGKGRALLQSLATPGDARRAVDDYAVTQDRLVSLVGAHLGDEEELVIPAILQHGERRLV